MFVKNFSVFFTFTLLSFCDSSFVENIPKCHLEDFECLRHVYQSVFRDIGKHGIPELNIPPVDPIHLTNVTVNVLNMANITMVDGVAKGVKDCKFEKLSLNMTSEMTHIEITCDMNVQGHYIVDVASPLLETFLGGNTAHGDGIGKVKINKLHLILDFPVYAQKREDGEIYLKCHCNLLKYEYEIGGPVGFFADNLYIGGVEISKQITQLMTENWRFIMSAFGKPFINKAMEFYFLYAGYFFDNTPARHFIIEDLSPYAKP